MSQPRFALLAALILGCPAVAFAQMAQAIADGIANSGGPPTITSITPPGSPLGKTTEWTVAGSNLAAVTEWRISGKGVSLVAASTGKDSTKLNVKVDPGAEPGYREVRAVGPNGVSNLVVVRVDHRPLVTEIEPNDSIEDATRLPSGSAAWGVLKAQDLDHFRLAGKAGQRVTFDLEAQRLGTPISPVLTVMTASGSALAQAHESRAADHDARLAFTFPADGDYVVSIRDNLYGGGDSAVYRLSVEDSPFATGMFPLGGPPGGKVEVTLSGGNLTSPRTKTITLPDQPGTIVIPGPFDGPGGPALAPMKLVVGNGPEIAEAASPTAIPAGVGVVNGRIDAPNEVDRSTWKATKGVPIVIRVRASDLGSQLDSVVTVRDARGEILVENDDPGTDGVQRGGFAINQVAAPTDSRIVYEPKETGPITIEVTDRYGDGGPGYPYRLEVGPLRPDFSVSLIFANPANINQQQANGGMAKRASSPGSNGALNVRAGQTIPINYLITSEGPIGSIEVRAEGLPPGVTALPRTIRPNPVANRTGLRSSANADAIIVNVDLDAKEGLGELRLVGEAKPDGGKPIVRAATATIAIDTPLGGTAPPRTVMRTLASIPLKVIAPGAKGGAASASSPLSFGELTVPGVLLQGGQIDLELSVSGAAEEASGDPINATVEGKGVTARMVKSDEGGKPDTRFVRLTATADCAPGVRSLTVHRTAPEGGKLSRSASVIVRPPIVVFARDEPVVLAKGKRANLWVGVRREPGFEGAVELEFVLPKGVRVAGEKTVPAGSSGRNVVLEGEPAENTPFALRVAGVARMPQGPVRVDSAIQPMIVSRIAEKRE